MLRRIPSWILGITFGFLVLSISNSIPTLKKWSFQEAEEAEADEPLVNYEDIAAEQAQSTA